MIRPVLAALFLSASACAAGPAGPAELRPALWRVADADTTIYLFGTVHLLPAGVDWRTERFDAALAAADTVVLEVLLPDDPTEQAGRYTALAASPGLPPLLERVPAGEREALAGVISRAGLQPGQLDGLETWAAALALGASLYRDGGLSPDRGVEATLKGAAAGKRVIGLESFEQQLGFFDTLPETAQRTLLSGLVAEAGGAEGLFAELIAAWGSGDQRRIAATYEDSLGLSPEVAEALLARRNAAWTDWVERRLEATPGTVMMAVGAGHLAGAGSLVELLQAEGLRVERVQ